MSTPTGFRVTRHNRNCTVEYFVNFSVLSHSCLLKVEDTHLIYKELGDWLVATRKPQYCPYGLETTIKGINENG